MAFPAAIRNALDAALDAASLNTWDTVPFAHYRFTVPSGTYTGAWEAQLCVETMPNGKRLIRIAIVER
jgi:hypothetical protein